jgi:hypothetical protein
MRGNKALAGALSAITAAVVGVILNLAIWFAIHTVFREVRQVQGYGLDFEAPVLTSVDPWALLLSVAAIIAMFRFKVGMITTLVGMLCCWSEPLPDGCALMTVWLYVLHGSSACRTAPRAGDRGYQQTKNWRSALPWRRGRMGHKLRSSLPPLTDSQRAWLSYIGSGLVLVFLLYVIAHI